MNKIKILSRITALLIVPAVVPIVTLGDQAQAQGVPGCLEGSVCWVKCSKSIHPLYAYSSMSVCAKEWGTRNRALREAVEAAKIRAGTSKERVQN
jgi:hypothetical protein